MASSEMNLSEIISGRLYVISEHDFDEESILDISVIINLTSNKELIGDKKNRVHFHWDTNVRVDEMLFEGLVRFCSSAIKGNEQKIIIVGSIPTAHTLSACVIREYLGCDAKTALDIVRSIDKKAVTSSELIETVFKYKVS